MKRKKTRSVKIGKVTIGGLAPIMVQSMTNTKTDNISETIAQLERLKDAGCDIARVAVPDMAAAEAIAAIKEKIDIPLVADIHFDYRLALAAIDHKVDGLRLNPGNIGDPCQVAKVVSAAKAHHIPIRIGVNAGSLDKSLLAQAGGHPTAQAMVASAVRHVKLLEEHDFYDIVISLKAHDVPLTIAAYQLMSQTVNYPLHLGITEAGTIQSGVIKSSVGIGSLLAMGIGDTLRVSLTGDPVAEVHVGNEILKSLGLKSYGATLVSCPTCGRCNIDLAAIAQEVEEKIKTVSQPITVAVMGCVVNGPGEAREADIGIAGGKGEGLLFRKGKIIKKVREEELVNSLFTELDKLIEEEK